MAGPDWGDEHRGSTIDLVLTNKNEKINWDSDHHTLNGAKFLGEIIFKMGWFNLK